MENTLVPTAYNSEVIIATMDSVGTKSSLAFIDTITFGNLCRFHSRLRQCTGQCFKSGISGEVNAK